MSLKVDQLTQAVALLDEYNKWRQGMDIEATDPKKLTKALHTVARELPIVLAGYQRYEKLRRVTVVQYHDLYARNLRGENFDSMVDEL